MGESQGNKIAIGIKLALQRCGQSVVSFTGAGLQRHEGGNGNNERKEFYTLNVDAINV